MKIERQLLTLTGISFFVVLVWTGAHFYDSYTQSTVSATLTQQIAAITPKFDLKTLQTLQQRQTVSPAFQKGSPHPTSSGSAIVNQLPTQVQTTAPSGIGIPFPSIILTVPSSSSGGTLR